MKNTQKKIPLKEYFSFSLRGWLLFLLIFGFASLVCFLLQRVVTSDVHVPLIFVLAELLIALTTDGYFYGILASVFAVFAVNWAFTYPYMKLDFSIYGYPITFITMLAVGAIVSTLTSRIKLQEKYKFEGERERVRANLLRSISHDLRTPLTSISGNINMVLDNGNQLSEESKISLLTDAKNNAEWLYRMVENLLSITRMSGGVGKIAKNQEVPEEVIGEAISKFSKDHPDVKITVTLPEEFFFIPMDAMLVEQLLMNLFDNAVAHGETTDKIQISVIKEASFVRIIVSDNGKGIDRDKLPHLFDGSLQLAGESGSDKTKFMGIGLAVCDTIVKAHGGEITAYNNADGGASFSFTLSLEE